MEELKIKRIGDLLSVGLLLISTFIFMISLNQGGITKIIGLSGSSVTIVVECWFLINWFKNK